MYGTARDVHVEPPPVAEVAAVCAQLRAAVESVVLGKRHVVERALICLLAEGHVLLADELNRAAPKTQSALLQVMQERQVTVEERHL